VETASTFPLPLTTLVPIQREFVRFARGLSTLRTSAAFSTG